MKRSSRLSIASVLMVSAFLLVLASGQGQAPAQAGPPQVQQSIRHDVSPPLRDIARPPQPRTIREAEPVRRLPVAVSQIQQADPVKQITVGPLVGTTPGLNFAGVGNGDYGFAPNSAPPDTNGDVGPNHVVQWVNESFAVFDKATGALVAGPTRGNALWSGIGGGCETNNDGDPIVQYDKQANRWILTQFSVSTTPFLQCVAVSTTSDATGSYNRYAFNYGNQLPDYPKLGVWPDAYYVTYNIFTNGQTFAGPKVCAWDRAAMLIGAPAAQVCFQLGTGVNSLLPSDLDGATPPIV